jgi:hypothetical protein
MANLGLILRHFFILGLKLVADIPKNIIKTYYFLSKFWWWMGLNLKHSTIFYGFIYNFKVIYIWKNNFKAISVIYKKTDKKLFSICNYSIAYYLPQ